MIEKTVEPHGYGLVMSSMSMVRTIRVCESLSCGTVPNIFVYLCSFSLATCYFSLGLHAGNPNAAG